MNKKLKLNLLQDDPILRNSPSYFEFYHDYVSPALEKLIKKNKQSYTIGLFGDWGSGKSTIIENLKSDFSDYPVFIFDAWKYQSDPLRRTFLINLYNFINNSKDNNIGWLKDKKPKKTFLDDLYISYTQEDDKPKGEDSLNEGYFTKLWNKIRSKPAPWIIFGSIAMAIPLWVGSQYKFGEQNVFVAWVLRLSGILGLSSTATALVGIIGKEFVSTLTKWVLEDVKGKVKTQKIIETREALNSPEQFEAKFKEIIKSINNNIVIVFDNIDRIDPDVAIQTLSTIKTFFGPTKKRGKQVVFIIPCDSEAIIERIEQHYEIVNDGRKALEYLRKLFNVSLWMPEFIETDIEDFVKKVIPLYGEDAKNWLKDENMMIVLNQTFSNKTNPREIKQYLNNLIATILIINNTDPEVREIIFNNLPYMAKVLTIRQKFPFAYKRLKENCFEPENILKSKDPSEFIEFMSNTNIITTDNAEPFIFFKKPNRSKNVIDDEKFVSALLSNNSELTYQIIEKNSSKLDDLINFLLGLYKTYKSKPDILFTLMNSFLQVVSEFNIDIESTAYFNTTADIIYRDIWNKYQEFNTEQIFKHFIQNTKTNKAIRFKLIDRYMASIKGEELNNDISKVKEILIGLLAINSEDQNRIQDIRNIIENKYAQHSEIMSLFNETNQETYITVKAFNIFIESINIDNHSNLIPILNLYSDFINEHQFKSNIIRKLNELLSKDIEIDQNHNDQKQNLYNEVDQLLFGSVDLLTTPDDDTKFSLLSTIQESYSRIVNLNTKYYMITSIFGLTESIHSENYTSQVTEAKNLINQFINESSSDSLLDLINRLSIHKQSENFVNLYTSHIVKRAIINGIEEIYPCYSIMNNDNKQIVINEVIDHRDDADLKFIGGLKELPDRVQTIKKLLDKATKLQPQDRTGIYNWIKFNVHIHDSIEIKDEIVSQIKNLLKNEPRHQETAYNFIYESNFLSEVNKREIGEDIIDWLKNSGTVLDHQNRFIIQSISLLYKHLSLTSKDNFIHELFKVLYSQPDTTIINIVTETLLKIEIKYKDFSNYFIDFRENMRRSLQNDKRVYLIESISKLENIHGNKKEKEYWKELKTLLNN